MKELVFGFGINDADYILHKRSYVKNAEGKLIRKLVWRCPVYTAWTGMLRRCFDKKYLESFPTYQGVTICDEWQRFSSFREWMLTKDFDGKSLDKDLMHSGAGGSKIYSPDTCCFLDVKVNSFMTERQNHRGEYLLGVCYDSERSKFAANCGDPVTGKRKRLGRFDSQEEAHLAWAKHKYKMATHLARSISDKCVSEALVRKYALILENAENILRMAVANE